jgi:Glycosyl transferases group 1
MEESAVQVRNVLNMGEPQEQIVPRIQAPERARVLAFATQGDGGGDEARLRDLLHNFEAEFLPISRNNRSGMLLAIIRGVRGGSRDLIVMEGTGVAGGLGVLLARWIYRVPFVLSSGDAVAPFLSARWPAFRLIFEAYERLLYRNAKGFIGWTPYLVGRALTLGTRRAMTAAGWAPYKREPHRLVQARSNIRAELGIPADAIVFGIAGSLAWSSRFGYCYGWELVQAVLQAQPGLIRVLIVGGGEGLAKLKELAGPELNRSVFLPGPVPRERVPDYLAAMDIASLPQSVDGVGSFRYTTKLSEYLEIGLPYVTNQIPAAYDLDWGGLWRLPGDAPWDPRFIRSLTHLMDSLGLEELHTKRAAQSATSANFCREQQIAQVTAFLSDLLSDA